MVQPRTRFVTILTWWFATVGWLFICSGLEAQDLRKPSALPEAPAPARPILLTRFPNERVEKGDGQRQPDLTSASDSVIRFAKSAVTCEIPHRITLEEAQAQARTVDSPMARLAQLQVEPARQLRELAHRMASAVPVQPTDYAAQNTELFVTKAKLEAVMFQADLDYREALAGLKALMHER